MPGAEGAGDGAGGLDVVGLGALNVDLIATRPAGPDVRDDQVDDERVATTDEIRFRIAREGLRPVAFLGGSAFNAIVMLAQLARDLRLGMVGISAAPQYGLAESHSGRMAALGIADLTRHVDSRPGVCLAIAEQHRRLLHTSPEANVDIAGYLLRDPRPLAETAAARVLHVTSLLEDPRSPGSTGVTEAVAAFVESARVRNPTLLVSFDPGSAWVDGLARLPALRRLYALADVLYVNPQEHRVLSGRTYAAGAAYAASLTRLCPGTARIIVKPVHEVAVHEAGGRLVARVPREDDSAAVDPTGAGDAVAAGVLAALGEGRDVVDGCRLGLRIAAQRVSDLGDRGHAALRDDLGDVWPRSYATHRIRSWPPRGT